jgi:hypothetical protein
MNNKERAPSQMGLFDIPRSAAHPNDKVLKVFTKLKRRAKQMETTSPSAQVIPLREIQPNIQEFGYRAMNSYCVGLEVVKTESGFEVV